ncbi:MAG: RNA methyltransferase [Vicinamibacterales bacterium]
MSDTLPVITSRRHPLVQACRDARAGGPDQPLLLDGWHLLVEAVSAGLAVDAVAVDRAPTEPAAAAALARLRDGGAQVVRASADVLQTMSPVRTPSGVVALARRPPSSLAHVFATAPALVLATMDVQDPGNFGALVRTAEAAGATGVVAAGVSADPFGWKALRASMGSAFRLPLAREARAEAVTDAARTAGAQVVALVVRDGVALGAVDAARPTLLWLGGEGPGLPPAMVAAADVRVTLPMRAPVESLNVAVAGALALYGLAARRSGR